MNTLGRNAFGAVIALVLALAAAAPAAAAQPTRTVYNLDSFTMERDPPASSVSRV